jgi:hypothetical protein
MALRITAGKGLKLLWYGRVRMSASDLYKFLEANDIDELGILDPIQPESAIIQESILWVQRIVTTNPKTFWFCPTSTAAIVMPPRELLCRWIPMTPKKHQAWLQTGPFPALLVKRGQPPFRNRRILWREPYAKFGKMVEAGDFDGWTLWVWKSVFPKRRALLFCHHCAVLPDIQRQIRILGIRGDFVWISDDKPAIGDAWPSLIEGLKNSIPMRHEPVNTAIPEGFIEKVKVNYSMVFTSHCMRYPLLFLRTGLPLYHINSTRFGNEMTVIPQVFYSLIGQIHEAIREGRLQIIHNNYADEWYFSQHFGDALKPFPVIQSLCDNALRFRIEAPPKTERPFLIWDTRSYIKEGSGSKILLKIYEKLGHLCDATSLISAKTSTVFDDRIFENYQAVIHIPYNVSTMSCFEQSAAGIPIWVPTPEFLEEILLDPEEHSELSWFCFYKDYQNTAMKPDQVWKPECVREFVKRADFYNGALNTVRTFSSVEDLVTKISTESYETIAERAFVTQGKKRLDVLSQYAKLLAPITSVE